MYTAPDCEIEEIKLLSRVDTKDLLSIDKSDTCKRPEDKYSFLSPLIFSSPSRPTVIIARSGSLDFREWDPKTGTRRRRETLCYELQLQTMFSGSGLEITCCGFLAG